MLVLARDSNRKNNGVPADPGCSGVPGFPYSPKKVYWLELIESLNTLLIEVVNSKPLTYVSDNSEGISYMPIPSHLIHGQKVAMLVIMRSLVQKRAYVYNKKSYVYITTTCSITSLNSGGKKQYLLYRFVRDV